MKASEFITEGASMMPYFKDPKDEKQMTWTFPTAWSQRRGTGYAHMSNGSMRMFPDALGYNPILKIKVPVPKKEFIARSTQWLQKILANPPRKYPTQLTQNLVDPKIYTGGREEGHMNKTINYHNELARKIIAKYPEVTHFGSN